MGLDLITKGLILYSIRIIKEKGPSEMNRASLIFLMVLCSFSSPSELKKRLMCSCDIFEGENITLHNGELLSCSMQAIAADEVPQSGKSDMTAIPPESLCVNFYEYENWMAMNVTWEQRESDIADSIVSGYFLVVQDGEAIVMYKVLLNLNLMENVTGHFNPEQEYILFQFHCYGTKYQFLSDGHKLGIDLDSLPMAHKENNRNTRDVVVTAQKGRRNKKCVGKPAKTSFAQDSEPTRKPITDMPQVATHHKDKASDMSHQYILISMVAAFVAMLVLLSILVRRHTKRKIQGDPSSPQTVLMVADFDNLQRQDMSIAHMLSNKLKGNERFVVTTNWENREDITRNPRQWYDEISRRANVVVFILPQGTSPGEFLKPAPRNIDANDNYADVPVAELECAKTHFLNWRNNAKLILLVKNYRQSRSAWQIGNEEPKVFNLEEKYSSSGEFYEHLIGSMKRRRFHDHKKRLKPELPETFKDMDLAVECCNMLNPATTYVGKPKARPIAMQNLNKLYPTMQLSVNECETVL